MNRLKEYLRSYLNNQEIIDQLKEKSDSTNLESVFLNIKNVFKIEDKKLTFKTSFLEAISGNGHELFRISSFISSSLLSLLFFYEAINSGGIYFTLNNKKVLFDKIYFEFKSPTLTNKHFDKFTAANYDALIVSSLNKEVIFIESKFTEFLEYDNFKISYRYQNDLVTKPLVNDFFNKLKNNHYKKGAKQLITHYSGIINYKNKLKSNKIDYSFLNFNQFYNYSLLNPTIYFISVLYDVRKIKDKDYSSYFLDYRNNVYNKFKKIVNNKLNNDITILNLTTFQKLYKYNLKNKDEFNKNIANFYHLDE